MREYLIEFELKNTENKDDKSKIRYKRFYFQQIGFKIAEYAFKLNPNQINVYNVDLNVAEKRMICYFTVKDYKLIDLNKLNEDQLCEELKDSLFLLDMMSLSVVNVK